MRAGTVISPCRPALSKGQSAVACCGDPSRARLFSGLFSGSAPAHTGAAHRTLQPRWYTSRSIDRSGSPFGCCRSECGYVHGWLLSPCGRKVCQNPQDNVRDLINEKKIVNVTLLNFVAHICGGARRTTVVQHVALPAHATCAPLHAARAQNMQHSTRRLTWSVARTVQHGALHECIARCLLHVVCCV